AILSVETYRIPLIGGTLTTIFAFFPMLLVSGILGQFLRTLPLTISATLIVAQIVALTIIPSLTPGFLNAERERKRKNVLDPFFDKSGGKFRDYIDKIISSKRMRFLTVITILVLFSLSMLLPITGILKTQMFPQTNQNYFVIRIETPKGTILNETTRVTREVENYLYEIKEVDNFITNIGTSTAGGLTGDDNVIGSVGATTDSNIANITVNLVLKDQREKTSYEIAAELKNTLENFKNAKINIQEMQEGPPTEAPITVRISGKNIDNLKKASTQIKKLVENIPQTKNVKISQEQAISEFKFILDRDILAKHGLSIAQVSSEIRSIIQGINTDTITLAGEEINIVTKYNLENSSGDLNIPINELEDIKIKSPKGYSVSLGELGKYSFEESTSSIAREDQKRVLKITSDIEVDANSVEINKQIADQIAQTKLPEGVTVNFGGDLEQIAESFRDLFKSMIIGLLLIALTLVLEFNSYKQTFIILLTLPMGLIAIFPGLILLGLDFSFPAFLGIVALAGVVVNNGIVLIDRINESRKAGMPFKQAIAESTQSRLAPIFLTSITSVIGMVPLAMTNEFWAGLGYSMAIGLSFSTILTLTCIPVYYYIFEIKNAIKNGERIE
ncbi:MAG: efflux RND transporter permease subunit, partial [Candidatus Gracilibacteria bacterium]